MPLDGIVLLKDRGIIGLSGPDAREFLQGLISNDMGRLSPHRAIYAALLTPQGKYLFDFILYDVGGDVWMDVDRRRVAELLQRLTMYRLRSRVELTDRSDDLVVLAAPASGADLPLQRGAARPFCGGVVAIDPRLSAMGARAVVPQPEVEAAIGAFGTAPATQDTYEMLRMSQGVPGPGDFIVQKSLLLESGFEELDGVSFDKGCFVGQELTARTKHRALVRKRLLPVTVEGPLPEPGTPLLAQGAEAGEMRHGQGGLGLALVRLEALQQGMPVLSAGDSRVRPQWPDWLPPRNSSSDAGG